MVNVKLLLNLHFRETCPCHDNIQVSKNKEQGQERVEIFHMMHPSRVPSFAPVTFSAQALNCLNAAKVLDFRFRR